MPHCNWRSPWGGAFLLTGLSSILLLWGCSSTSTSPVAIARDGGASLDGTGGSSKEAPPSFDGGSNSLDGPVADASVDGGPNASDGGPNLSDGASNSDAADGSVPDGGTVRTDPRPNIVIVLADDMGFSDIGSFG